MVERPPAQELLKYEQQPDNLFLTPPHLGFGFIKHKTRAVHVKHCLMCNQSGAVWLSSR